MALLAVGVAADGGSDTGSDGGADGHELAEGGDDGAGGPGFGDWEVQAAQGGDRGGGLLNVHEGGGSFHVAALKVDGGWEGRGCLGRRRSGYNT